MLLRLPLIPANAGTLPRDLGLSSTEPTALLQAETNRARLSPSNWIPAFAGMSGV